VRERDHREDGAARSVKGPAGRSSVARLVNQEEGAAKSDEGAERSNQEEKGPANTQEGAVGATWFTGISTKEEWLPDRGKGRQSHPW